MSSLTVRRASAFVACGLFFAAAVILLLGDRSSSVLGLFQRTVVETGRQVEGTYDIDVLDREDVPGTADQIGHALLWGSGMFLVGWLARYRLPIALTALFMASASLAFEVAQPALSATRVFQPSDLVGNVAGIVAAALLLAVVVPLHRLAFPKSPVMH